MVNISYSYSSPTSSFTSAEILRDAVMPFKMRRIAGQLNVIVAWAGIKV